MICSFDALSECILKGPGFKMWGLLSRKDPYPQLMRIVSGFLADWKYYRAKVNDYGISASSAIAKTIVYTVTHRKSLMVSNSKIFYGHSP